MADNASRAVEWTPAQAPAQPRSSRLRTLKRAAVAHALGTTALGFIVLIIVVAIAAPLVATHDPLYQDYTAVFVKPSPDHFFGTDRLGRDVFSRVVYGARVSLAVGVLAVSVGMVLGVPLGLVAGYTRGWVDNVLMRFMDAILVIPGLIFALTIIAILKPTLWNVMLALGIDATPRYARLIRGQAMSVTENEYIVASRALGCSSRRIIFRHVFPNALSPVIVQASLAMGGAVLAEAGLGFLGVGVQPPTPTWGSVLNQGAPYLERAWWVSFFPGLAIFLLVLSFNLVGDALRDMLDPRLRGR